jgi:hypothetical protein
MRSPGSIASKRLAFTAVGLLLVVPGCTKPKPKPQAQPCAPGTRCLAVDADGRPNPDGTSVAQCSGTFPDYIVPAALFPAGYSGPWFFLAADYPKQLPTSEDLPWRKFDFRAGKKQADGYLYALRDYAFDGMIEADFRPDKNARRRWYHAPLMNYYHGRELVHGVTEERPLEYPELGIKRDCVVRNFAVGLYNDIGAYTFGKVFARPNQPDASQAHFAEGAMVFKVLFSAATPEDFEDPAGYLLEGAPSWQIATQETKGARGTLTTVRLLQMDVAVRDDRAQPSGWVFGTFAFDRNATDDPAWKRLRPVGLMWGNDPGSTPENVEKTPLKESLVSDEIPAYAKGHLGWAGRVNGPVDNPDSACMSCHQTAQVPAAAGMVPDKSCTTEQKVYWFRNLSSGAAFGAMDEKNRCQPAPAPKPASLDFSLQLAAAVQSLETYGNVNPCKLPTVLKAPPPGPITEPRIER